MMNTEKINTDKKFMKLAIEQARTGKTPFGCVIASDGEHIVEAYNTVKEAKDPTAHAEINAIRKLAKKGYKKELPLTIYTTGEPCAMCMGAIMFAGIGRVVYGLNIDEISRFQKQINISSQTIARAGFEHIEITSGILHEECLHLFKTGNHVQH